MRLTDLSRYNKWWGLNQDFPNYDSDLGRIKFLINRYWKTFEVGNVYIIRGPRRSGKSTYIKLIIKKLLEEKVEPKSILYVPCDRLSSRRELHKLLLDFIKFNVESERIFIFIDEATYLPEWFLVIKDLAEELDMDRICIVATGSSPVGLKEASERLPGRRVEGNEFWLMPISFREFIMNIPKKLLPISGTHIEKLRRVLSNMEFRFEKPNISLLEDLLAWHDTLESLLDIYLRTGGMPEFIIEYLTQGRIREKTMEILIRFVLGEISKAKKSEHIALGVLRYLTDNLMQRTDYSKISSEVDSHHATVRDIIETLQKALIVFQVSYLDVNTRRFSMKKQKKFAFSDISLITALRSYIYGLAWDDILWEIEKIKPHLIENLIISTAIMSIHEPYKKEWWSRIGYYYTERYEIDLTILSKVQIQSYEVKYREKVRTTRAKITITKNEFDVQRNRVPASYILATATKNLRII